MIERVLREIAEFEGEVQDAVEELMHDLALILKWSQRQPVQA